MKITYLGTTTLLFDDGTDQILFDAHVTRPSLTTIAFSKLKTNEKLVEELIERFQINRLKAIFVSHSHHDHVMDAPCFAQKTGAVIYGTSSALNVGRGGWIPEEQMREYHHKESFSVGNYEITVLKSLHSKAHFYNNDLGQLIEKPVVQPARKKEYKEGGSYDFLINNGAKTYLIRPSYNFIPGQLDGIQADVLFLGIGGLSAASLSERESFFAETVEKVQPQMVIPVHWDNFFKPLMQPILPLKNYAENTDVSMKYLAEYCSRTGRQMAVQMPLTTLIL